MKIAQFINTRDDGGAETLVLTLTQELLNRGFSAEIHAFGDSWIYEKATKLRLPIIAIPKHVEELHSIKKIFRFGKKYGKFLKERNIDILHSHVYSATLRGAIGAYFGKTKHIATQHDNYSISNKWSRRLWLNIAGASGSKLVMISNQMLQHYVNNGLKEKYCSVIHNGINESRFCKVEESTRTKLISKLNVKENDVVYVSLGRLQSVKGFDLLIRSFNYLKGTDFKLFILGDGPLRTELEELVKELDLEFNIKFIGSVNNVEDYLSIADVFVLSSRNEGLSCSIIEAMFSSLPVIVTDVGGNRELINDLNGFLSPSEDIRKFGEHLCKIQNMSRDNRKQMGKQGYQKARSMFTLEKMTDKYLNIYCS